VVKQGAAYFQSAVEDEPTRLKNIADRLQQVNALIEQTEAAAAMDESEGRKMLEQLKEERLRELANLKNNLLAYINKFYPEESKKENFSKFE